jgi:hypothetical protein
VPEHLRHDAIVDLDIVLDTVLQYPHITGSNQLRCWRQTCVDWFCRGA